MESEVGQLFDDLNTDPSTTNDAQGQRYGIVIFKVDFEFKSCLIDCKSNGLWLIVNVSIFKVSEIEDKPIKLKVFILLLYVTMTFM